MSAIYFLSYETIETIETTMYKVEIDDIRKKLPSIKDKSDDDIIEEVKNGEITAEDLEIDGEVDSSYFDETNSIKGSDQSNSFDSDIIISNDLDDWTPHRGLFQMSLEKDDIEYIDKNSWKDWLVNKFPKYELTFDEEDEDEE